MDLIQKLKKSNLTGRGGAGFPTWKKWEMVKCAPGDKKYVVCNLSEGEPGVLKDRFILENYLKVLIEGIELAMETVKAERAFLAVKDYYYDKYFGMLQNHIGKEPIEVIRKTGGYIAGEETTLLEMIENNPHPEPRIRPPYPVTDGLWHCPTLIDNAETLYSAALIARGKYKGERFVSISGDCPNPGVFSVPENYTIKQALEFSKNIMPEEYFIQIGGGASGTVLNQNQLDSPLLGMAAIVVYNRKKTQLGDLALKWARFFRDESCGKCVPCREGAYRLVELLESENPDWQLMFEIFENLKSSSFCAFGSFVPVPFESLTKNILCK